MNTHCYQTNKNKVKFINFFIAILLLGIALQSKASWNQTGPLYGSFYIKEVNNALWGIDYFVQSNSGAKGLYKSNNGGNTWIRQNTPGLNCIDLIYQNNTYILGTSKGLYKSINNGLQWVSSNTGLSSSDSTSLGYKLLEVGNNRIFAYGSSNYFSDNNGLNWTASPMVHPTTYFQCIYSNNKILAATGGGVYISSDNALTWSVSNSGLGNDTILTDIINFNNDLYCIATTKVYKSSDNGQNWVISNAGSSTIGLKNLFVASNKLYATATDNTYEYYSSNGTWGQSSLCQSESIEMKGYYNGTFFGYNNNHDAIIKTSDLGINWIALTDSIKSMNVNKFSNSEQFFVIGQNGAISNSGGFIYDTVQHSFNRFTLYNQNFSANTYAQYRVYDIKKRSNGTIYLATAGGVWKSINNGASYTQSYNGLPFSTSPGTNNTYTVYDMFISGSFPNDTLFVGTTNGIYYSTDDAQTFIQITSTNGVAMQQFLKYNGILYCAGAKVFKRTSPNNWAQFTTFTSTGILGFAATDGYLFLALANSPIKYAPINGLSNFSNIITGTGNFANAVAAYDTLLFFYSTAGVYKVNTTLLGNVQQSNLVQIADNLPYYFNPANVKQYSYLQNGLVGNRMAIFNGKLWLGTNGMSTFYRSLNDFGYSIPVTTTKKETTTGGIVFPNPTRDKITITGFTKGCRLTIYNSLGQPVSSTIYSDSQTIDISKLNTGIYTYSVTDNNQNIISNGKFIKE